jgi:hypothetical protein
LWSLEQVRCLVVGDENGDSVDGIRARHSTPQKTGEHTTALTTPVREISQRVPGNTASSESQGGLLGLGKRQRQEHPVVIGDQGGSEQRIELDAKLK